MSDGRNLWLRVAQEQVRERSSYRGPRILKVATQVQSRNPFVLVDRVVDVNFFRSQLDSMVTTEAKKGHEDEKRVKVCVCAS